MENMRTKLVAAALASSLALGAGITLSQPADAQTESESAEAQADRMQQREERLQAKVDDGVITQERADEIRARMAEKAARREARKGDRAEHTEELAALFGTTADELTADLHAGISLAELAQNAGIDIDVLIDQIEARRTAQIEQAVVDGHIDGSSDFRWVEGRE